MCDTFNISAGSNGTHDACANITSGARSSGISEEVLTKDQAEAIGFAFQCVTFPIVTVLGIAGSVLSLIVLSNKKLLNTTAVLLIGLAIADCSFLIANYLRKSECIVKRYDPVFSAKFSVYSFIGLFYVKTAFSRVSTWLIVAISAERLVAVAFPLQVKYHVTKTRMAVVVVSVYILTFGLLALMPLFYKAVTIGDKHYLIYTEFHVNNKEFLDIYNKYFSVIVFRWVPKLLVIMLNTSICVLLLRQSKKKRQIRTAYDGSRQQKDQARVTKMLLIIAAMFVVCLLPGDAFWIANTAVTEFKLYGKYHYLFLTFSDVSLLFEMINSSANFAVYIVVNRSFSSRFKSLLCLDRGIQSSPSTAFKISNTQPNTKPNLDSFDGPKNNLTSITSDSCTNSSMSETESHTSSVNLSQLTKTSG